MNRYSSLYQMFSLTLLLGVFAFTISSCDDDDQAGPSTFSGERVAVGAGFAWSEVTFMADGTPLSIAAVFDHNALEDLPQEMQPPAHEFVLALPDEADLAPYDHITLDWNAHGHEPPGVYDVPHFDVHFYFMSEASRDEIAPTDSIAFSRPLPAEQLAPMYLETPGGVPRMGAHIIDLMSPEIAGTGTFTHTFIYGKYDGALNFLEPMVSEQFLRERTEVTAAIRRPEDYGQPGFFPSTYKIEFDENLETYRIALTDFVEQ